MRQNFASASLAFLLLWICVSTPYPAMAGPPTEQIRGTVDRALAILKNPALKSEARKKERRDQLRQVIYAGFDFPEMAKRSLGSNWRRLSQKEQDEFVRLFTDLLERAYVGRIEAYDDEKFVYLKETQDQDYAEVQSRIFTNKGEEFSLNYKAHLVGGQWRVYDVVVENISLVNNYRAQFNRIITNSSYEELVRRMKAKQIEVTAEKN
jgi:phospholipid transport system substrate-binding protein